MKWYWVSFTVIPLFSAPVRGDGARRGKSEPTIEQMLKWREEIRREMGASDQAAIVIDAVIPLASSPRSEAEDERINARAAALRSVKEQAA